MPAFETDTSMRLHQNAKHCVVVMCLAMLLLPEAVHAQDRKAEQAIKHRRAAFALMSTYFSRLLQTVEGDRPFNASAVASDTKTVEMLSQLPWEGFAPGSEKGDTKAKEDIWLDEDKFKLMAKKFQDQATNLSKVGQTGDLALLKTAFNQTRDACNACHKEFRNK
jgi:cytochrome c556